MSIWLHLGTKYGISCICEAIIHLNVCYLYSLISFRDSQIIIYTKTLCSIIYSMVKNTCICAASIPSLLWRIWSISLVEHLTLITTSRAGTMLRAGDRCCRGQGTVRMLGGWAKSSPRLARVFCHCRFSFSFSFAISEWKDIARVVVQELAVRYQLYPQMGLTLPAFSAPFMEKVIWQDIGLGLLYYIEGRKKLSDIKLTWSLGFLYSNITQNCLKEDYDTVKIKIIVENQIM